MSVNGWLWGLLCVDGCVCVWVCVWVCVYVCFIYIHLYKYHSVFFVPTPITNVTLCMPLLFECSCMYVWCCVWYVFVCVNVCCSFRMEFEFCKLFISSVLHSIKKAELKQILIKFDFYFWQQKKNVPHCSTSKIYFS